MLRRTVTLTPAIMDRHGILKRFHKTTLADYYGAYPDWKPMKKMFYSVSDALLQKEWKQAREIYKTVQIYHDNLLRARETGQGLFMYGNSGTGKSLLLMSLAKQALHLGMSIRVVSAQGLINLFAKSWDEANQLNFERFVMRVPFLFVEELGKEHMTQLALPTLTRVVKFREEAQLPTCFTSNEDFEKIQKTHSVALASSIMGTCRLLHFDSRLDWRSILQEKWQKDLESKN